MTLTALELKRSREVFELPLAGAKKMKEALSLTYYGAGLTWSVTDDFKGIPIRLSYRDALYGVKEFNAEERQDDENIIYKSVDYAASWTPFSQLPRSPTHPTDNCARFILAKLNSACGTLDEIYFYCLNRIPPKDEHRRKYDTHELWVSRDGMRSFKLLSLSVKFEGLYMQNDDLAMKDIFCLNDRGKWMLCDNGFIVTSQDYGRTWASDRTIGFLDYTTGLKYPVHWDNHIYAIRLQRSLVGLGEEGMSELVRLNDDGDLFEPVPSKFSPDALVLDYKSNSLLCFGRLATYRLVEGSDSWARFADSWRKAFRTCKYIPRVDGCYHPLFFSLTSGEAGISISGPVTPTMMISQPDYGRLHRHQGFLGRALTSKGLREDIIVDGIFPFIFPFPAAEDFKDLITCRKLEKVPEKRKKLDLGQVPDLKADRWQRIKAPDSMRDVFACGNVLYRYCEDSPHVLSRSTDLGRTWSEIESPHLKREDQLGMAFLPVLHGGYEVKLFVKSSGVSVMYVLDEPKKACPIDFSIPAHRFDSDEVFRQWPDSVLETQNGKLVAYTVNGISISTDRGKTWSPSEIHFMPTRLLSMVYFADRLFYIRFPDFNTDRSRELCQSADMGVTWDGVKGITNIKPDFLLHDKRLNRLLCVTRKKLLFTYNGVDWQEIHFSWQNLVRKYLKSGKLPERSRAQAVMTLNGDFVILYRGEEHITDGLGERIRDDTFLIVCNYDRRHS